MAKQVENRVVEMEFKNKDFEKAIEVTMKSLDELNKKIDELSKVNTSGFDNLSKAANNVNFDGLAKNIDYIADRFSLVGIAAQKVKDKIVDAMLEAVQSLAAPIDSIFDTIKEKGESRASNLEFAKFQLEGLGVAWDKVKGSIDEAVNDTRFGMDEAAVAASQLAASGVQLGEKMTHALLGISGVAAMTNAEYSDIARIFTKVAGTGKVYATTMNEIGTRGLNAWQAMAEYVGVTEQEMRDMVSDKDTIVDFTTFAEAMFEKFGEQAKKGNDLFSGALANTRAALGRIGEKFYTPLHENLRQALIAIKPVINDINKALDPMFNSLSKLMENVKDTVVNVFNAIHTAFNGTEDGEPFIITLFGKPVDVADAVNGIVDTVTNAIDQINAAFDNGGVNYVVDILENVAYNIYNIFKIISSSFKTVFADFNLDVLQNALVNISRWTGELKMNDKLVDNLSRTLSGLWAIIDMILRTAHALLDLVLLPILKALGLVAEDATDLTAALGDMLVNIDANYKIYHWMYPVVNDIAMAFYALKDSVIKMADAFDAGFKKLTGMNIEETFHYLLNVFETFSSSTLLVGVGGIFYGIGEAVAWLFEQFTKLAEYLSHDNGFTEFMKNLTDQSKVVMWLKDSIEKLKNTFKDLTSGKKTLSEVLGLDKLKEKFQWINPLIEKFKEHYKSIFEQPSGKEHTEGLPLITALGDNIKRALESLDWEDIFGAIGAGFYAYWVKKVIEIKNVIAGSIVNFTDAFSSLAEGINMSLVKLNDETFADKVLKIAAAVGILALSLVMLSKIDSATIEDCVFYIGLLMAMLGVFVVVVSRLTTTLRKTEKVVEESDNSKTGRKKLFDKDGNIISDTIVNFADKLKNTKETLREKINNISAIPSLLIALGASILLIVNTITKLTNAIHADPQAAMMAVAVVGGIMAGLFFITKKMLEVSKTTNATTLSKLKGLAIFMVALGFAIKELTLPLVALTLVAKYSGGSGAFTAAVLSVGLLMAEMAGIAYLFAKFADNNMAPKMLAGAGAMALMGVAIQMLTIPLIAITVLYGVNGTATLAAVATVAVLMAAMGGIVIAFAMLCGQIAGAVPAMLAGAAAMLIMGFAINTLIAPISVITGLAALSPESLDKAMQCILALMGIMALLTALFGLIGGFTGGVGAAGMVAGAASMLIMAEALNALLIPLAAIAALNMSGQFEAAFTGLVMCMIALGVAAAAAIVLAPGIEVLSTALLAFGGTLLMIGLAVDLAGKGILALFAAFMLLEAIDLDKLQERLAAAGEAMITGFVTALVNSRPKIAMGIMNLLSSGLQLLLGCSAMIAEACILMLMDVITAIDNHAKEIGFHLGHALLDIIEYALMGIAGSAIDLLSRAFGGEGGFSEFLMENMLPKKNKDKKGFLDGIKGIFGGDDTKEEAKEAAEDTGKEAASGVTDGIMEGLKDPSEQSKLSEGINNLLGGSLSNEATDTLKEKFGLTSDESINEMINTYANREGDLKDATGSSATAAADGFVDQNNKELDRYFKAGEVDGAEFMKGFNSQKGLDINSPSKKTREAAHFTKEGFELGLQDGTSMSDIGEQQATDFLSAFSYASKAAESTVRDSALAGLADTMARIGELAGLDDYQPTITPVLDLSDVNAGFQSINSLFSSRRGLALAGEASAWQNESMRRRYEIQNDNSAASYEGFGTIGTKLDELGSAILNRQVVLDSGEVVGGLAEPMDRALGVRMIRSQRTKGGR